MPSSSTFHGQPRAVPIPIKVNEIQRSLSWQNTHSYATSVRKFPTFFDGIKFCRNRGYQMSVGLILYLLNELNKNILCGPLVSIIFIYSMSSINLVMNLHEFNVLFITYPQIELLIVKKRSFFTDVPIM